MRGPVAVAAVAASVRGATARDPVVVCTFSGNESHAGAFVAHHLAVGAAHVPVATTVSTFVALKVPPGSSTLHATPRVHANLPRGVSPRAEKQPETALCARLRFMRDSDAWKGVLPATILASYFSYKGALALGRAVHVKVPLHKGDPFT